MVYQENKHQGDKVEYSKDVLGRRDVSAPVRSIVKPRKDVQKTSWVDKRSGVTLQLCVVICAIDETLHLGHVGLPVNLCVCHPVNDPEGDAHLC